MMKVTLIVFMLSSSTLAMGPGPFSIGFDGGLGLNGGHGINTDFSFNRFGLGVIGNGYHGYKNGHGKGGDYNRYNGNRGLNGFRLLGNGYDHRSFGIGGFNGFSGFKGFNSLLGIGFGKFGGVYH